VTQEGVLVAFPDLARFKIAEYFALEKVMKRIVTFMLLVVLSVAVSLPAQARTKTVDYWNQSKSDKQQTKMLKKQAKQQQKAMKRYAKEQRKEQRREQKANRLPL
jgi:hypothetical protein